MDESTREQVTRLLEMERAQIGHEIHDELIPLLVGVSASLPSLASLPVDGSQPTVQVSVGRLRQALQWLDNAMQSGRRMLTDVYPPEFAETLWSRCAQDTVERLFGSVEGTTEIDWQLPPEIDDVSKALAFSAYRIVVEAVRNAIRHGKASRVTVSGQNTAEKFQIIIRDDGIGFDSSAISPDRFGLRTMAGRAHLVGGTLNVESVVGSGTTITFAV
jgi:signal transduction histidine kinase